MRIRSKEWWRGAFDERYSSVYATATTPQRTRREVRFLIRVAPIRPGSRVLDVACGDGRHSIALAKFGATVTGFDYSPYLLRLAKRNAERAGVKITFRRGDMRHLPFQNRFDAVINMFTSFGYFKDEANHLDALKSIRTALRPHGVLVMDLLNPFRKIQAFIPDKTKAGELKGGYVKTTFRLPNGSRVSVAERFNVTTMRWRVILRWKKGRKMKKFLSDVRVFTLTEIRSLLKLAGFRVTRVWGDFDGGRYAMNSPRLIIRARRTEN